MWIFGKRRFIVPILCFYQNVSVFSNPDMSLNEGIFVRP